MSVVKVTGSSKQVVDRTPFIGYKIPNEVKMMSKFCKKIDKQLFRKLLTTVVESLEGKESKESTLTDLVNDKVSEETLAVIFSGLYTIVRVALKQPDGRLKQEMFQEDLKDLKIPMEFIPDITSAVYGSRRGNIEAHSQSSRPRVPQLQNLQWRVDVAISTSSLNRVLEPCINMEMLLSDGTINNFEIPISKFHELRYSVSAVLKDMDDLEKRSILKVQT